MIQLVLNKTAWSKKKFKKCAMFGLMWLCEWRSGKRYVETEDI